MHNFRVLADKFATHFDIPNFPSQPASLYEPAQYFLSLGGKRIRPVMCLMGNELFDEINPEAYHVAAAIELFHNFTLIHDDIMDNASLRRGMETIHEKYGNNTALLAGDIMVIAAYERLSKISPAVLSTILKLFNRTAKEVCEGQQLDMDFEKKESIVLEEYIKMIELKTSVLLAASLQMGAIMGIAGQGNQEHVYEFGKNLGIAFQIQDDYLDAFGNPDKIGKERGGDIKQNKKTFLLIHAMESCKPQQRTELLHLMKHDDDEKVEKVLNIYKDCNVDQWAKELKQFYINKANSHLEKIAVVSSRKSALTELAEFLIQRDY